MLSMAQSWVLFFFLIYFYNINSNISSKMKLLTNDTKIHRGLSNIKKETQELQSDTDQLAAWTEKWSRLFNLDKCEVMRITHEGCPIHPNRYDSSKAVCESFYGGRFAVNASCYTGNLINHLSLDGNAYRKSTVMGCWKCCRIDSIRLESSDSYTRSRFVRHLEIFRK